MNRKTLSHSGKRPFRSARNRSASPDGDQYEGQVVPQQSSTTARSDSPSRVCLIRSRKRLGPNCRYRVAECISCAVRATARDLSTVPHRAHSYALAFSRLTCGALDVATAACGRIMPWSKPTASAASSQRPRCTVRWLWSLGTIQNTYSVTGSALITKTGNDSKPTRIDRRILFSFARLHLHPQAQRSPQWRSTG